MVVPLRGSQNKWRHLTSSLPCNRCYDVIVDTFFPGTFSPGYSFSRVHFFPGTFFPGYLFPGYFFPGHFFPRVLFSRVLFSPGNLFPPKKKVTCSTGCGMSGRSFLLIKKILCY